MPSEAVRGPEGIRSISKEMKAYRESLPQEEGTAFVKTREKLMEEAPEAKIAELEKKAAEEIAKAEGKEKIKKAKGGGGGGPGPGMLGPGAGGGIIYAVIVIVIIIAILSLILSIF